MSPGEFARLDILEQRIAVAWDEAALALAEIKTGKLYRTTRDGQKQTWDEYCQRVHGFTPQWANTLIKRAKQLQRLNAESETPLSLSPTAVGHLEGLPPHEQAEVVKLVTKDGKEPTAKDVSEAKHRKLMDRFRPGGDMHQTKQGGKKKEFAGYLVTVVTPDKDELTMFGKFLPSPITDFKAQSVAGWVTTEGVMVTLQGIGKALAAALPKKLRLVVERG
jgi:hypothetical protein